MKYRVSCKKKEIKGRISLASSKSESNRALIIQALCQGNVQIENLSNSNDTIALEKGLKQLNTATGQTTIDIGAAGTSMRFLTAFAACREGKECTLTGSERMKQRPIKILVDVLRQLGADIQYLENEGYPPLHIRGKHLKGGKLTIKADVSSQYITAILLLAPSLEDGLYLSFDGTITSRPYLEMSLKMMRYFGIEFIWRDNGNAIEIKPQPYKNGKIKIEADWSAASYWYLIAVLSKNCELEITGLKKESLQGDSKCADIFKAFHIETIFTEKGILIKKTDPDLDAPLLHEIDFSEVPDIAQTLAVAFAATGSSAYFTGLHTLKIKETDRIQAIINELAKLNIKAGSNQKDDLTIHAGEIKSATEAIKTYEDHRMAMSFAPLALRLGHIDIEDPVVVNKSYPDYWNDLKMVGFEVEEMT